MAIVNICGFETGDFIECNSSGGTCSINSGTTRTGTYSLRVNPTTSDIGYVEIMPLSSNGNNDSSGDTTITTPVYARFYFRIATLPASNEEFLSLYGNSGVMKMTLRVNSTGNIIAYNNSGTSVLGTGSTALSTNTWYRIEVQCGSGGSAPWEVKIDGVTEISGTSNNLSANFRSWCLGKRNNRNNGSVDFYYDDASFSDSGYPGRGGVKLMIPDSDGTTTNWTPSVGNRWACVNEIPHNGDTDYISHNSGSTNHNDVGLESTATSGISGSINAIKCVTVGRRASGGAVSSTSTYIPKIVSNGIEVSPADVAGLNVTTYNLFGVLSETDPDTSAAWTTTGLNAVQLRVTSNVSNVIRVTSMVLNVDFDSGYDSYTYDTSGKLLFAGVSPQYVTAEQIALGVLSFNGLGILQSQYSSDPLGELLFGGIADVVNNYTYDVSGRLLLDGTTLPWTNSYAYLANGSLLWVGEIDAVVNVIYNAFGVISLLGISLHRSEYTQEAEGSLLYSGTEPIPINGCTYEASGYITFRDRTLLAWWRLDEGAGTNLNDSSLYKRTGTTYNNPAWVDGNTVIRYGSPHALEFDGFTQYAQASAEGLTNRAFTILLWAKPKSLPNEFNVSRFVRDMVGSILWLGETEWSLGGRYVGTGGIRFLGVSEGFDSNSVEARGQLNFTGIATERVTVIVDALGTLMIMGLARVTEAIAVGMTGNIVVDGIAGTFTTAVVEALGKLIFNGVAVTNNDVAVTGSGGMLFNGRAVARTVGLYAMDGALIINGLATTIYGSIAAGGFALSGIASITSNYTYRASGKLTFNGVATAGSQSVHFMVPNGDVLTTDWVNEASGTTNLYQSVDEGTVSPNDTDYVTTFFDSKELIFDLTSTPNDFASATGIIIRVRQATTSSKNGRPLTEVQMMESDNVTAMTTISAASSDTTITTYGYSPTLTGANTKAKWDGSRIRLKVGTGSLSGPLIYAIQVELYYNSIGFAEVMTGQLAFKGTASVNGALSMIAQGGLVISGIAEADSAGYRASGRLALSGSATCVVGVNYAPVGALRFSGYGEDTNDFMWVYTVNDTFTPTFTGNISIECWAGGCSGGLTSSTGTGAGGGGAYAKLNSFAVTSGNNYTVNVGTGGIQNVTGDSWFNTTGTVFASQGVNGGNTVGGVGGQAINSIGDVVYTGGSGNSTGGAAGGAGGGGSAGPSSDGNIGANPSGSTGGAGGAAVTGGGAGGRGGDSGLDGVDGSIPGGGGGGAGAVTGNPGAGARGEIIIRRL